MYEQYLDYPRRHTNDASISESELMAERMAESIHTALVGIEGGGGRTGAETTE